MVDTVRSMADLLNAFRDGQADNSITEQDMRDFIVSSIGQTGWADYTDSTFTTGSPQSLPALTNTKVLIDGAVSQTQELPFGVTALWANDEIPISVPGTSLIVTFETNIRRASGSGSWDFESYLDIGLPGPVELYPRTVSVNKAGDKKYTFSTGVYCLDTWATNGGEIYINPSVAAEIYGSRVVIHHLHRGRGTYP